MILLQKWTANGFYSSKNCVWFRYINLHGLINVKAIPAEEQSWCYLAGRIGRFICIMVRVFTNGPGDLGSIPGRVIPKTQNTQNYKVWMKGKVEQPREKSSAHPYNLV